jgi:methylaspartate ammonia-lyase
MTDAQATVQPAFANGMFYVGQPAPAATPSTHEAA